MDSKVGSARWERQRSAIEGNARRIVARNGTAAAIVATVATVTAPLGVGLVLGKLLMVAGPVLHALVLRVGTIGVVARDLRTLQMRRALLRWIPRLLFVASLWIWSFAAVPIASIVAAPLAVATTTVATAAYTIWAMDRVHRGVGIHPSEWLLLAFVAALACAFATVVVLLAVGVLGTGWLVLHVAG